MKDAVGRAKVPLLALALAAFCSTVIAIAILLTSRTGSPSVDLPRQTFKSTNVTAPSLTITKSGKPLANGLLAFAPEDFFPTALLMTDDGELVWSGPVEDVANPSVQTLFGKPVLSRWTGTTLGDSSYGQITILDTAYSEIHVICPKFGLYQPRLETPPECEADVHESLITTRNTLLVPGNNVTRADLRSIGGPKDGWTYDGQFYEIDIETGEILFRWSSLEHVPISKTVAPLQGTGKTKDEPFDYFHINSIQLLDEGFLVSARHTSTIYNVGPNGNIVWEFNGRDGGDFAPIPDFSHFNFQHDARHQNATATGMTVHIFNNANSEFELDVHPSDALEFHLDFTTNSSQLIRRLRDPSQPLFSTSQGNYTPLSNGNILVGYGDISSVKEYGPDGNDDVRMTIHFGGKRTLGSYRVYRKEWHAVPASKPDLAVHAGVRKGYVSWNGATDVSRYVIYAGVKRGNLIRSGEVRKSGFETEFELPKAVVKGHFIQVGAFHGKTLLKKSKVVKVA